MNILIVASEWGRSACEGKLGGKVKEFAQALAARKHRVSVVLPLYRTLRGKMKKMELSPLSLDVPVGEMGKQTHVWHAVLDEGVRFFAIERDEYFDREGLYGDKSGAYCDNAARFGFFCRAAAKLALYLEPQIDVIHSHEWHSALVGAYVKAWGLPFRTMLTVHDIRYQGNFSGNEFGGTYLPENYFCSEGLEFYGNVNFLKAGILLNDAVAVFGKEMAEGMKTPEGGYGLDGVVRAREAKLHILGKNLNGKKGIENIYRSLIKHG